MQSPIFPNSVVLTGRCQARPLFGSKLALMRIATLALTVIFLSPLAQAADWLTLPSRYSHNPNTGERVAQYTKIQAPSVPQPSNFRTSGYTHTRSSLNYGQSADNYHRVEQWGDPVRPYGEWRFPYRPYSTPYPNWGPPYAGLNLGLGYYGPFGTTPYDPYRGAVSDPDGRYPMTLPQDGSIPPGRGPAVGGGGLPGDGLLPPAATMSTVPNRDGVGMPVDGIIPEGELLRARDQGSLGSRPGLNGGGAEGEQPGQAASSGFGSPDSGTAAGTNYPRQRFDYRQRFPNYRGNRGGYRPTPQPSPFNPYPSGPGTPYPVAPYYDGYYPVYRD